MTPTTVKLVLDSSRLRWSSPLLFNDPAEFQRMPCFSPTLADAYKQFPGKMLDVVRQREAVDQSRLSAAALALLIGIRALVQSGVSDSEILESLNLDAPNSDQHLAESLRTHFHTLDITKARIFCVTTEHDNDAMWANYAAGHSGCVLGFRHLLEHQTPLLAATQVTYSKARPVVGSGLDFLLYGDNPELRKQTTHAVCFTKKSAWSHEREWRALTWRWQEVSQHGDYPFLADELESVTIGSNADVQLERDVLAAVETRYPRCGVYRLEIKHGESSRILVKPAHRAA